MAGSSEAKAASLTVVFVLLDAVLWLAWLALVLFYVPHMEHTFRDFNMKLPWITESFLALTRWVPVYWYVLGLFFVPCLAADAIITFLLFRKPGTREVARLWTVLMLLLPAAVLLISGLALYLPMLKLHEGLSR
jgi:type II secretory pathway component PulF